MVRKETARLWKVKHLKWLRAENDKEINTYVLLSIVYFICNLNPEKRYSRSAAKVNALLLSLYL